jgi:nitrate reductase gamma subunit
MTLLEFARGPAMQWSLIILAVGVLWRITGIVLLRHKTDHSEPRQGGKWLGALKMIGSRSWSAPAFRSRTLYSNLIGYAFHIGLAIVVFGFLPHILFIKDVTGLSWPNLPNGVIYVAGVVTMAALIAALVRRMTHPVLRMLSNFDDYASWVITILPVATGLAAVAHLGARYETLLALHILSFQLLLVWLPFGKLGHSFLVFMARGTTGMNFARRGART